MPLAFRPLTPELWPDFGRLFGANGACGGCWCMWWRLPRKEFPARAGEANRAAFRALVEAGPPPGVIAHADGEPAAWCAVGPRDTLPGLDRSRTKQRVDDRPVWSVNCFFVHRNRRRRGLTVPLLEAAVAHAAAHGATIVEGYPLEPEAGRVDTGSAYVGVPKVFLAAGFEEVARRSPRHPVMRRVVEN